MPPADGSVGVAAIVFAAPLLMSAYPP